MLSIKRKLCFYENVSVIRQLFPVFETSNFNIRKRSFVIFDTNNSQPNLKTCHICIITIPKWHSLNYIVDNIIRRPAATLLILTSESSARLIRRKDKMKQARDSFY